MDCRSHATIQNASAFASTFRALLLFSRPRLERCLVASRWGLTSTGRWGLTSTYLQASLCFVLLLQAVCRCLCACVHRVRTTATLQPMQMQTTAPVQMANARVADRAHLYLPLLTTGCGALLDPASLERGKLGCTLCRFVTTGFTLFRFVTTGVSK